MLLVLFCRAAIFVVKRGARDESGKRGRNT
jgi:hypothetical protein